MSLQGTFDTLSVTELFGLLSTAAKTGALRLEAGQYEASLLVRGGRCCAVDDGLTAGSVGTEAELGARLVDVGFTVARQPAGTFRFSDGDVAEPDVSIAFEPAVAEIAEMVAAWKDIETAIPSLDARLGLAPKLAGDEIVLRAAEWALLVRLEARPTVRELVASAAEPLLDVCRQVKDLVERGAVEVGAAPAPAVAPEAAAAARAVAPVEVVEPEPVVEPESAAHPAPEARHEELPPVDNRRSDRRGGRDRSALEEATSRLLDPIEPYAPEADEAEEELVREPVAVAADRDGGGESSTDRGALLRLFSALKE